MSVSVPEPLHHFLFDELVGPKVGEQNGAFGIELDCYVPVHGLHRGAVRFGRAAAQVAKFPPLSDLPLPWTLAVWLRRDGESGASTLLSSDTGGIKIEQWGAGGKLGITRYGVRDWSCGAALPLARWCHLTVVAELEETRFYVDGMLAGTIDKSIPLPRRWLGSSGGWTEFLQASLEDLRLYAVALTPAQVLAVASPKSPASADSAGLTLALKTGGELGTDAELGVGVVPTGRSGALELQVTNSGSAPLVFTPTLSQSAGPFSLTLPASRVISPGTTKQLTVVFRPQVQGPARSTLTIESSDGRCYVLPLTGVGDVPIELPVIKTFLAKTPVTKDQRRWLGRVLVGSRKTFPVSICNTGTAALRFELAVDSASGRFAFWQGAGPFDLEPGGEFCADLAYSPTTEATEQAEITIRSNDPDHPFCSFAVYGRGMPARPALQIGPAHPTPSFVATDDRLVLKTSAPVGQTVAQLICLRNAGGGTVTLRAPLTLFDASDDAFTVEQPASFTIPLGGVVHVPIHFTPTTGGSKTGRLRIDWEGGSSELQLVAQGMP